MSTKEIAREIHVKDLLKETKLVVRIKGFRVMAIRLKIIVFIIKLVCKFSPLQTKIEILNNKGA